MKTRGEHKLNRTLRHAVVISATLIAATGAHAAIVETGDVVFVSSVVGKYVGSTGTGTLMVDGGSAASETASLTFGWDDGSHGTGEVRGPGTSLDINGDLSVGFFGSGVLTVADGAVVDILRGFTIANLHGSDGRVELSGGATLDIGSDIKIGFFDGAASLSVSGGSVVSATQSIVIAQEGSTADITVTGAGSSVVTPETFQFGFGGDDEPEAARVTLTIARGGLVQADANDPGSPGDLIAGFGLTNREHDTANLNFIIGDDGTGSIASGGVQAGYFFFGGFLTRGTATLGLDVDPGVTLNLGDRFTLIDYDDWDGEYFDNVADGGLLTAGDYQFQIDYETDLGGGDFALTATVINIVPEPGSLALLTLGGALVALRRRG